MPLYEYSCHRCGKNFEVIQKFSDEPLKMHEECGGDVERLVSPSALQFKGSGWYVTDYARGGTKGNGSATKSESNSESKAEGKSESKSESKAETKSEGKAETKPAAKTESKSETKS
jgi:putative FmdB family regulatory protein